MPNLDFYAVSDDWSAVFEAVFDPGLFRVFESDSEPDRELREFHAPTEVPDGRQGRSLARSPAPPAGSTAPFAGWP